MFLDFCLSAVASEPLSRLPRGLMCLLKGSKLAFIVKGSRILAMITLFAYFSVSKLLTLYL